MSYICPLRALLGSGLLRFAGMVLATYHQPDEYYELKPYLESLNLGYKFRLRRSCFCFPLCDVVLIAYVE